MMTKCWETRGQQNIGKPDDGQTLANAMTAKHQETRQRVNRGNNDDGQTSGNMMMFR